MPLSRRDLAQRCSQAPHVDDSVAVGAVADKDLAVRIATVPWAQQAAALHAIDRVVFIWRSDGQCRYARAAPTLAS